MPNDTKSYPADSYENMLKFAKIHNFNFHYLYDQYQKTAGHVHIAQTFLLIKMKNYFIEVD